MVSGFDFVGLSGTPHQNRAVAGPYPSRCNFCHFHATCRLFSRSVNRADQLSSRSIFDGSLNTSAQKRAREEEKRRMVMEEERRKQAAKEKLLELEARMAKRESEVTKDSDASMYSEIDNWEISQRMVERITSASSDSSAMDRPFDQPFDRVQMPSNPWKREAFEAIIGGRVFIPLRSPDAFPHLEDQDHRWNSIEGRF